MRKTILYCNCSNHWYTVVHANRLSDQWLSKFFHCILSVDNYSSKYKIIHSSTYCKLVFFAAIFLLNSKWILQGSAASKFSSCCQARMLMRSKIKRFFIWRGNGMKLKGSRVYIIIHTNMYIQIYTLKRRMKLFWKRMTISVLSEECQFQNGFNFEPVGNEK